MVNKYKYVNTRQHMRLAAPYMMRYGRVKDISHLSEVSGAGVSFISYDNMPPGSTLEIAINSPMIPHAIKTVAKTTKNEKTGIPGTYRVFAHFTEITNKDKEALRKLTGVDIQDSSKYIELPRRHFSINRVELSWQGYRDSTTKDISAGGIAFFSNEDMPPLSQVELEVNFPTVKHAIKVTARVIRTDPTHEKGVYKIAAQFTKIDENDKLAIDAYIKSVSSAKKPHKWWWRKLK